MYDIFSDYDTEKLADFVCACHRIETDKQLKQVEISHKKMYRKSDIYNVYKNNNFPLHLKKEDVKYRLDQEYEKL